MRAQISEIIKKTLQPTPQNYKESWGYYNYVAIQNGQLRSGQIPKTLTWLLKTESGRYTNMDRSITRNENELIIFKKFQTNRSWGSEGFTGKFHQTFREESTPILLKLF